MKGDTKKRSLVLVLALASEILVSILATGAAFDTRPSISLLATMDTRSQGNDAASTTIPPPMQPESNITVLTPSHSSSWNTGSCHAITWINDSSIPYVNIDLDNKWYAIFTITTGIPNTGSYNWSIPAMLAPGVHYEIKIENYEDTSFVGWSADFTINNTSDALAITSPSSSSKWIAGSAYYIEWTRTSIANFSDVSIYLYDNDTYVECIGYCVDNDGMYYWSVPENLFTSGMYTIRIFDYKAYYIGFSSAKFTIIGNSNAIEISYPSSSTTWTMGSSEFIEWTAKPSISRVNIYLYDSSSNTVTIATNVYDEGYQWSIPTWLSAGNFYRIKIVDSYNSSTYAFSSYFTITQSRNGPYPMAALAITLAVIFIVASIIIAANVSRKKNARKLQQTSPAQAPRATAWTRASSLPRAPAVVFCPQCGVALSTSIRFCPSCGMRQQQL